MKTTMGGEPILGGAAQLIAGTVDIAFTPLCEHQQYAGGILNTAQEPLRPDGATCIVVQAISQNVRFALGPTAPTATRGFRITSGNDPLLIPVAKGVTIQFIEEAASAVLEFQWGC